MDFVSNGEADLCLQFGVAIKVLGFHFAWIRLLVHDTMTHLQGNSLNGTKEPISLRCQGYGSFGRRYGS